MTEDDLVPEAERILAGGEMGEGGVWDSIRKSIRKAYRKGWSDCAAHLAELAAGIAEDVIAEQEKEP